MKKIFLLLLINLQTFSMRRLIKPRSQQTLLIRVTTRWYGKITTLSQHWQEIRQLVRNGRINTLLKKVIRTSDSILSIQVNAHTTDKQLEQIKKETEKIFHEYSQTIIPEILTPNRRHALNLFMYVTNSLLRTCTTEIQKRKTIKEREERRALLFPCPASMQQEMEKKIEKIDTLIEKIERNKK